MEYMENGMSWRRMLGVAGSVASLGMTTQAMAAGAQSWTGFYAGLTGGYGLSRSNGTALPGDPNTDRLTGGLPVVSPLVAGADGSGWFAGALAGYNWQVDRRAIVGIEADLSAADLAGRGTTATLVFGGQNTGTFNASQRLRWFGTLRGRAGVLPSENLLLYATGGLAVGGIDHASSLILDPGQSNSIGLFGYGFGCGGIYGSTTCFAGDISRTAWGWAAGLGGEYRATQNVTLRFEYLYLDFGKTGYVLPAVHYTTPLASVLNASGDSRFNLFRLGASYRF
jgi:outer membrane immunogenic protein